MSASLSYRRIIAGEAGPGAAPCRALLRGLERLYRLGVNRRNRHYDRRGASFTAPVPVISVGNLTAGGTGKTPFVIDLIERLERVGRNPVVVSRGYKALADEPNDEQRLIQKHCPALVCLADPDRVRAAQVAHDEFGADVVVLDDGFQHRRLARQLDVVLIDATCPFGYDHLLPRGLLREPVENLRRAHVVVITRADQVARSELDRTDARVRSLAPNALHLQCRHRVVGVERLDGTELADTLAGRRAVLFAALGNPQAFLTTVQALGVEVVGRRWWPDHHQYRPRDVAALLKPGRYPPHDLLLTTEKDAVKLHRLGHVPSRSIAVVRVAIDFIGAGGTILQDAVQRVFAGRA